MENDFLARQLERAYRQLFELEESRKRTEHTIRFLTLELENTSGKIGEVGGQINEIQEEIKKAKLTTVLPLINVTV